MSSSSSQSQIQFYKSIVDYPELTIYVDNTLGRSMVSNELTLFDYYKQSAETHNENVFNNPYSNAGFDIITPVNGFEINDVNGNKNDSFKRMVKVRTGIRCNMFINKIIDDKIMVKPLAFTLHPRSSTGAKTNLRLSNNTGIIDSGYRGELMGVFDLWDNSTSKGSLLEEFEGSRLLQICAPSLDSFMVNVKLLETEEDVNRVVNSTKRGEGGFGSTGR